MNYQDFCVKQIKNVLSLGYTKKQLESVSYKYALKTGVVGLYAETYLFPNGKENKFFDINFNSQNYQGKYVWKNLLGSEKAYELCLQIEEGKIKHRDKNNKKVVFYEHIEPKSITYSKCIDLNDTNPSEDKLRSILNNSKLVILTYEEKELLDSKTYGKFNSNDESLIRDWENKGYISKEEADQTILSMKGSKGKFLGSSSNGTALARIAHLIGFGVKFCWGINEDKDVSEIELIHTYLKDDCHIIK